MLNYSVSLITFKIKRSFNKSTSEMDEPDDTIDHQNEADDTLANVTPYDKEHNPENIQWGFIKTGKATGDGIVHTHNRNSSIISVTTIMLKTSGTTPAPLTRKQNVPAPW